MAAPPFSLKVVTPDRVFFEGKVTSLQAPGSLGYLGVLKDHAPLVTTLDKGKLSFKDEQGTEKIFKISGGFLEVLSNRVLVLTDQIQPSLGVVA
ncbi:MAG: ATP synthase F1 subunit epsilon [Candidatus Omnitrophica bacterium]|nr:ATP synthase F1 subunit epsilon [Candidatus Omnitrophota bacterium]